GDDPVQLLGIEGGGDRLAHVQLEPLDRVQAGDDVADDLPRVRVVFGDVVDHAGLPAVRFGAALLFGRDDHAGGGLHQRPAGEEDGARIADDDRLVRHGRDIGAAGGAAAHDAGDLGDRLCRHPRLVEEDAAEMVAVGEDLGLVRQVGPAGIDQVDAGQVV